jgi:hypothetical protein
VFGIAFAQWIREGERRSLPDIASNVLHELVNLTGGGTAQPSNPGSSNKTARPEGGRPGG